MKKQTAPTFRSFYLSLLSAGFLAAAGFFSSGPAGFPAAAAPAPPASTGTTQLITIQGGGAGLSNGDYVSDLSGLDTAHRYFIEVPPGLGRLTVEIFDADVGLGGTGEASAGRDRARNSTFNSSVRYTLVNPSGRSENTTFTTGDATAPAGADNAWLALLDSTGDSVQDNFSVAAYNANDGTLDWNADWLETNDDGSAATGNIRVTAGELQIGDDGGAVSTIEREADLTGFPDAFLSFNCRTAGVEPGDQMRVQISANGGGAWTTLETFTGTVAATTRSYDVSSFISTNTRVRFVEVTGYGTSDFFFVDNLRIKSSTIPPGHWQLSADMSSAVTTGDDINAFGLRAHDGTSGAGGTELNVYADSVYSIGVNPPVTGTVSRGYTLYPYITSGCSCGKNDFDFDVNNGNTGSLDLSSRTGGFTQSFDSTLLSGDNSWRRDAVSGWTNDNKAREYGIWTLDAVINSYLTLGTPNGNYASLYFSNYQAAANPPAGNPAANALRIYLPTDTGGVPLKPYLEQDMVHFSGPNPPVAGQTVRERVVVRLVNPTPHVITFSAGKTVTANVPGGGAVYGGNAQVGQGSVISQPTVGGTGNISWNPGTVAAGATTVLIYDVLATPAAAGQRVPLTATPASGSGTRAAFVDETGNPTQTRATATLGPLCELALTAGTAIPSSNCGTAVISPASLPAAVNGVAYSQAFSPSVQLYSGTLPNGLTLAGGTLSGIPTQPGVFSFVVGTPLNPGISPTGCATSGYYTLTVSSPTAANAAVGGRVATADGRGIPGAVVELTGANGERRLARTNSFGYFRFYGVAAGETYVVAVRHKTYAFDPRVLTVDDNISDLDFEAR
ncbi:MAG: carboxypeptidase regulatory-like domain-containing protein [Acidobacteria bacterium]|nr:carboxypeptidase regulatory-like domain-containing protein [Acidobacteriota bacterium]